SGTLRLFGKPLKDYKNGTLYKDNLSLLPQDGESVFIRSTVREELKGCEAVLEKLPFDLSPLFDRHPYDLSGGERQLVALCKALSTNPRLLILDEPSKGLDPVSKQRLANLILQLKNDGMTLLIVSHDVSFAALCADRCALFFDGALAAAENTADFMNGNRYYTTAASRITRGIFDNAYTVPLAIERMKGGAQ
ncbi:MAG: ABC transporter ATP-binding protein, partial [Ruminococcus sp.]|nr:ABC transporter ATP-binding protein [Ruminococcus sp.]